MTSFKLRTIALAMLPILSTGCGTTVSSCPPVVEYDQAFNQQLADELAAPPSKPATVRAIGDYYVLRRQVRACR